MTTADPEVAAIQAFSAAMCELDAPECIRDDLPGYLAAHGVDPADAALISRHREQLLVYRAMVHSRLRGVIAEYSPRTLAILGPPRRASELAACSHGRARPTLGLDSSPRPPRVPSAWAAAPLGSAIPRCRRTSSTAPATSCDSEVSDGVSAGG